MVAVIHIFSIPLEDAAFHYMNRFQLVGLLLRHKYTHSSHVKQVHSLVSSIAKPYNLDEIRELILDLLALSIEERSS